MNIAQNLPSIQTLTRRSLLAGLPAAAVAPAAMAATDLDLHPQWLGEWRQARAAFCDAANEPGGGNFDTPKCLALRDRIDELERLIQTTRPKTVAGAVAMIGYVLDEAEAEFLYEGHEEALKGAMIGLIKMAA